MEVFALWIGIIASFIGILAFIFYLIDKFCSEKYQGKIKTFYGDTSLLFGSNIFIGCPNILMVENEPIFTTTIKKSFLFNKQKLLISIVIFDSSNKIVAQIEKNKWFINRNNYYKMLKTSKEIKVINQNNEIAIHCSALPNGLVKVNGTFYVNGTKISASDNGLVIDSIRTKSLDIS